jgi:uncharacterized protein involved in exopolysaccharide biosynthesis
MALFFSTVMALVVAVAFTSPRAYRSTAKLFIRLGRENVTLDATATLGQSSVVSVPATRENEINSVVEVLRTRSLREQVLDRVGPAAVLGKGELRAATVPTMGADSEQMPESKVPTEEEEQALLWLAKNLDVEAVKKTNIIQIRYDGPTPEIAQAVVRAFVEFYLERHVRLNRTPGAFKFLNEQTGQAREDLLKAEQRLHDLQTSTGLFASEAQKQIIISRIGRLEDELLQSSSALAATEAEVTALRTRIAQMPETVETRTRGMPNEAANNMRAQLYTLQLKELELLARHPAQHPELVLLRQQVSAAKEVLAREEHSREQVATGPSRVQEEARIALGKADPLVAALKAKTSALRTQLQQERTALKSHNDSWMRVAELQRAVDVKASLYRRLQESLAQTQVDRSLEEEKISNINVVQPASYEVIPVRPRRMLLIALGLVFALCGSLALALLAEAWGHPASPPAEPEADVAPSRLLPGDNSMVATSPRPPGTNGVV